MLSIPLNADKAIRSHLGQLELIADVSGTKPQALYDVLPGPGLYVIRCQYNPDYAPDSTRHDILVYYEGASGTRGTGTVFANGAKVIRVQLLNGDVICDAFNGTSYSGADGHIEKVFRVGPAV